MHFFSLASHLFGGRQVSSALRCMLPFFRVSVGALDVRAASGHSQHFSFDPGNLWFAFLLGLPLLV